MHPFGLEAHGQTAVQCRQKEMSQQQNSSRAVLTQIEHEPGRLEAQGQSTELLFGPGLLNERVHTRFELKLSRCSAAANSGFASAVQCKQGDSSQQQNSSRTVSSQRA